MSETSNDFISAAEEWLCDGYALDIRYVARPVAASQVLISAVIVMRPLIAPKDFSFAIATDCIIAGQYQRYPVNKRDLMSVLTEAAQGTIGLDGRTLKLVGSQPYNYYSEMERSDRWFSELHIQIGADNSDKLAPGVLANIDNDLRASAPPFDGLSDLNSWLGTSAAALSGGMPTIVARVVPPVDLIFERCELRENVMTLVLHAHKNFDTTRIRLAVRGFPGEGLESRQQVAKRIEWSSKTDDKLEGIIRMRIENCDSVLAILMIGPSAVRRHWFLDPAKARSSRYMAVQHFDADLRKIRVSLESQESAKFEQGVAALLFLLGFSPVLQLETDSPDLIATTPDGQLVLIECTTRISDFSAKVGKLVDRRGSLSKALVGAGHPPDILAVLVCRSPRDQIAAHEHEVRSRKILLWAREELLDGLDRVRHPGNSDKMVENAKAALESKDGDLFGPSEA